MSNQNPWLEYHKDQEHCLGNYHVWPLIFLLSLSAKLILLFHCYFFSFKEVRHARLLVDMANRRRTLRSLFNLLGHLFVVREDMKVKFCLWGNTGQVLFVRTLRWSFVCEDMEVTFCFLGYGSQVYLWGYGGQVLFRFTLNNNVNTINQYWSIRSYIRSEGFLSFIHNWYSWRSSHFPIS